MSDTKEIYVYCQLTFNKSVKIFWWGKNNLFNKQSLDNQISTYKEIKFNPYYALHTKSNSKWIIKVNVKAKMMRNTGKAKIIK